MKRLLPLLLLVCVAAGDEIPGWNIRAGKWAYDANTEEIWGLDGGSLAYHKSPISNFEMVFDIYIEDYTNDHNMTGISFRGNGQERYKLSFRSFKRVAFDKTWKTGEKLNMKWLASQPIAIPKMGWIPVKLIVRGGKMKAIIGKTIIIQAEDPDPLPPGALELVTFSSTARFRNIKIKVRGK